MVVKAEQDTMALENRINELIEARGITAYRFAKDVGISLNTVYGFTKHGRLPSTEVLEKICRVYGVTPNEVLVYIP